MSLGVYMSEIFSLQVKRISLLVRLVGRDNLLEDKPYNAQILLFEGH